MISVLLSPLLEPVVVVEKLLDEIAEMEWTWREERWGCPGGLEGMDR
jgi:hypothetical protein